MVKKIFVSVILLVCFNTFVSIHKIIAQPLAFPGAVGFGKNVTGGRNGTVYHVTNLNDAGAGSFRDAVSASNRIIVFDVSGYITLKTAVSCKSNLTIAGQTAPGEGIGFRGGKISCGSQSNIIIRHIRIRPGSEVASDEDVGINLVDAKNIIIDHCSIEFAPWNNIGGVSTDWQTKPVQNITFQNCLIANPTYQQFGAHIECPSGTWTWAYNIFANSHNRNPLDKINDIFVNNVLYNCSAGYTTHTSTNFKHDIINNYFVKGPASTGTDNQWYQVDKNQSIYYSGNLKDGTLDGVLNGSGTTPSWYQGPGTILTAPWSSETANIPIYSAATAFRYTSSFAGTFPYDEMDRLIISQVRTVAGGTTGYTAGTRGPDGKLYTTQTQTGLGNNGYGTIVTGTRPTDTDNDGMPDFWEKAFGLNVTGNDAMTKGSDGYANIEKYINWLAEPRKQTTQNTAVDIDLSAYTGGFTKVSPVHSITSTTNGTTTLSGTTARFTPTSNFFGMGSFKFKVTGSDGTEFTFTVSIVVVPSGAPCTAPTATLTAAGATTFCQGNNVVLNANTGTGLTYQWKNGTTVISGATAASYTATASGSYTAVVTNASNCSATSSAITVNTTALPTATITAPSGNVIPFGGSIVLNASTGSGYTYQWKRNTTNISGATAASYTATTAGSYTVTITAATCSATSAASVLTTQTPPLKYIYNYDNSGNLSWSNTNSWTPKTTPRDIDTVIIRTGEVQINALTHTAPVYVETNGILRLVTANSTVNNIHMQGGTLKVFTSTPELALTSDITVEQPSTIMAGSVAATIFTINGTITGNASLTKTSVGILRINSTASSYKGNWIVAEGKLQLRSATGLGLCGVQVKSGARLDIEVAGSSIYSLVVETGGGVDLDQPLTTSVAVLGTDNILTGVYQNANYPAFIGSTSSLNVSNSLVTLNGPTAFCQGNNLILTSSSGASYIWKNNATQVGTAAAYTTAAAGSYTVDATSPVGCKVSSAPVVTTIATAPIATITTSSNDMCSGASVVLTASSGTSYKWFNGTTQVGTASSYTATAAGSYTVEVTNASGCKATSAATQITGSMQLTPTITAPATAICSGASVVLTSSTGASYKWYNGATQVGSAATYTATSAGSYTVEVTNTGGCKATSAVMQITVSAAPTATITASATSFCPGSSVVLTASTGTSYKWFNGTAQVGTTATYTATTAGSYTVEITNASGCKATSAATQITVSALPTATISTPATSFCEGGSTVLTASTGSSYTWFNGTTQVGTGANYTATDDGSYTVEVTNTAGCKASSSVTTITEYELPVAIITAPSYSFCTGTSVLLTASTGTSYKWFNDATQVGTSSSYAASTEGSYTVEVTNSNGCKATSTAVTITESTTDNTKSIITASSNSMCAGGSVILTSSSAAAYKWFNGTTQVATSSAYTATTAGTYTVEATNASGCKATSDAIELTISSEIIWYQDTDGDGNGDPSSTLTACTQPAGYVSAAGDACPNDENKSVPGNCGCGNSEASCADCAGVVNGTAFLDNCSICVGGTTGNTACVTTTTVNGTTASITVTPQPFDNATTIKLENNGNIQSITIISAAGALVDYKSGINTTELLVGEELIAGLYTVTIQTDKGVYTTKIVKK